MEEIILEAESRDELGKSRVKHLRDKGSIPAVVYTNGKDSQSLKISGSQLLRLLRQYRLENTVINLKVKAATKTSDEKRHKTRSCLIKEVQYDPVKGNIIHVDFNEISLTKAIKVAVPVATRGEPQGVKLEGGSLEHILWEIDVECLPTEIPKEIEIDVSQLKIGDSVHIKDITFLGNIKVLNHPEAIVVTVAAPLKEEVVVPPTEEAGRQEPEVIKEKKEIPTESEETKEAKEK